MNYRIRDIQPNPFRHIDRYPIRRDKVEALKESLRTTGFWDNVVARVRNGKPQIAYGHHRLFALREEYGPDRAVRLIVRDLSDDQMLKIMARENMEEWGTSAAVEQETVRAVVEAYAEGRISLPAPSSNIPQTSIRYAPSFIAGQEVAHPGARPYTAAEVADFLGWMQPDGRAQRKVMDALAALQFIEEGILTEVDFDGLTTKQAQAVVEQARRAKADREAAARIAKQEAARAEREAREAEVRRARAERQRQEREVAAARARDEAGRRQAAEQARRAEADAREAEQVRVLAEQRQQAAAQREREERQRGQQQARTVGQHVSKTMKSGRKGYKQAAEAAAEVREKRQGPPPHIDDFARRLATNLNKILDDRDDKAQALDVLIRFGSDMAASSLRDLHAELEGVATRATAYAERLMRAGRPADEAPQTVITVQPAQPARRAISAPDHRS